MYMLNVMIKLQSFGLIQFDCKAVADLVEQNLVAFKRSFKKIIPN